MGSTRELILTHDDRQDAGGMLAGKERTSGALPEDTDACLPRRNAKGAARG